MKKKYVKPQILLETFTLQQNIAAGCYVDDTIITTTLKNGAECTWTVAGTGLIFFRESNGNCVVPYENGMIMAYCYNNPEGGYGVFAS